MAARKRRRSEAFSIQPAEVDDDDAQDGAVFAAEVNGHGSDQESKLASLNPIQLEEAEEIWIALKEELHETVEQLPLSLHRTYDLMTELEQQVQYFNVELLTTMHAYVSLRKSLADKASQANDETVVKALEEDALPQLSTDRKVSENSTPTLPRTTQDLSETLPAITELSIHETPTSPKALVPPDGPPATPRPTQATDKSVHSKTLSALYTFSPAQHPPGTPGAVPLPEDRRKAPRQTHELLSHVAWLSEEALRASEEKVNLANAAYDMTDRHIRLLDQAIKEQETAITMGLRAGTHPTSIVLPELVVPQAQRGPRKQRPPAPEGRRADSPRKSSGLKITLPPAVAASAAEEEERYCFCNQPSYGKMIACDNPSCKYEWFHLSCIGLATVPDGDWWCPACLEETARKRKSKRRHGR